MKKIDFNKDWKVRPQNTDMEPAAITLPHDAMLGEKRHADSVGGKNIGWFECLDYEYTKNFVPGEEYSGMEVILEFEGVYNDAKVYLNDELVAERPYGYSNFTANLSGKLKINKANQIKVIAKNSAQPNSRWYSGTGIYRPVWLYVAEKSHIEKDGIRVRTLGINPPKIEVQVETTTPGSLKIQILDGDNQVAVQNLVTEGKSIAVFELPDAKLWSVSTPDLYKCRVQFEQDTDSVNFGIRTLTWDSANGISMNGEHLIIKGACIHHDNGLLGACTYPEAEERRVKILKECGYNAIRSAHNPCSKYLLDACDKLGMLVMDEFVDVWYIHKTEFDYALHMEKWWKQDLTDMVIKDYNHPCVIIYSTGNEVAETAQKRGIQLTKDFTEFLHSLDNTRPVTCGINIFFNLLSSMGFGVYSDEKAKKEAEKIDQLKKSGKDVKKKSVGSEFYNNLAGLFGDKFMKIGASTYPCDVKTRDAFANMDIAGYNYGILRYKKDMRKYPDRLILGSETFCKDAYTFYEMAKKYPRLVGDFVWAGMDYIGECGIGAWEYEDYAPADGEEYGWLTAGSGRIDITGRPNGEAAYTKVVYEMTQLPQIAVKPVYQKGKHSPSAWKMTDAIQSWTWPGCDGYKAVVEVYARAAAVELYVNGEMIGRKKLKNSANTTFDTVYHDGEIRVKAYDENGRLISENSMVTAGRNTKLSVVPEKSSVKKDGLCYIPIRYTDASGIVKPMEKHNVKVTVKGGRLLGLGNACSYNIEGYLQDNVKTYYGEALAICQANGDGDMTVTFTDEKSSEAVVIKCEV